MQFGGPAGLLTARACAWAGGRILLKNTTLHLFRGRRYGLCGANGAGKSTLMRSIAAGQLDVRACPGVSGARAQWLYETPALLAACKRSSA